ncbi:MAG: hypothetical protein AMJ60_11970, partial [Desulfobacterales bacterium SG8_35]
MTDITKGNSQNNASIEVPAAAAEIRSPDREHGEKSLAAPGILRGASYVLLFVAAVFVINAMETGSYRTPWPVALGAALAGFALLGYSW